MGNFTSGSQIFESTLMVRSLIFLLLLFPACIAMESQPVTLKTAPGKLVKLFESAQHAWDLNNQEEAIKLLKDALDKEENFIDARILLGDMHYSRKEFDDACDQMERVIKLDPDYAPRPYFVLG